MISQLPLFSAAVGAPASLSFLPRYSLSPVGAPLAPPLPLLSSPRGGSGSPGPPVAALTPSGPRPFGAGAAGSLLPPRPLSLRALAHLDPPGGAGAPVVQPPLVLLFGSDRTTPIPLSLSTPLSSASTRPPRVARPARLSLFTAPVGTSAASPLLGAPLLASIGVAYSGACARACAPAPAPARVRFSPAALRALRPTPASPLIGPTLAPWRLVASRSPSFDRIGVRAPLSAPAAAATRAFDAAARRRARVISATAARARAALAAHAALPALGRPPFPLDVGGLALGAEAFRARFRRRLLHTRSSAPSREFSPRGLAPGFMPDAIASVSRETGLDPSVVSAAVSSASSWSRPAPYTSPPPGSTYVPSRLSLSGILALGAPPDEEAALVSLATRGASTLSTPPRSRAWRDNHPSAYAHAHVVDDLVAAHRREGWLIRVTDLYRADPLLPVLVSPMAVVPKSTPGKFRLILDGSSHVGDCVNDFSHLEAVDTPLLASFDAIVSDINALRDSDPATPILLVTTDFSDAYKQVPIRADDWWQLAQVWRGEVYWNVAAAFGLRASGHHLGLLTRAFARRITALCAHRPHTYVDDGLLAALAHDMPACREAMEGVPRSCGMPLSAKAAGAASTQKVFCGWLFDTEAMTISLPSAKLAKLRADVARLSGARRVRRPDLVSLLGALYAASKAIRHSRAYLSTIQSALVGATGYWVTLSAEARDDVAHWLELLDLFNGVSFMRLPPPSATVLSDACTSVGYGWVCHELRIYGRGSWAVDEPALAGEHINVLELAAGLAAADAVAARLPVGSHVQLLADNTTAVASIKRGQGARGPLEHALRSLALFRDARPFSLSTAHLQGVLNVDADALSRGHLPAHLSTYSEVRLPAHSLTAICSSRRRSRAQATRRS